MPLTTENRRRAAGCHLCLTVPARPNVGLAAPDRPALAWVYPELYEQDHPCDQVSVLAALAARGGIMESLAATITLDEARAATPTALEALTAKASAEECLVATPFAVECLAATIAINTC
jgi:hypothetical protein